MAGTINEITNEILEIFSQIENLYKSFNLTELELVLNLSWMKIGEYLDFKPDILKRIARRCGLPPSLIILCLNWLSDNLERPDNDIVARTISQIIRYAVKKLHDDGHNSDAEADCREKIFCSLLSAFRTLNNPEVKSQLTWALGYLIPNTGSFELSSNIFGSTNNISKDAKDFLFNQIRQRNSKRMSIDSNCDARLANFGAIDFAQNAKLRADVYVTQTQNTVQIQRYDFKSEKTKVSLVDLFETFKAKTELLKDRFTKTDKNPEEERIKAGSDLWWYQDTYMAVAQLQGIAKSHPVGLRHEDVNIYLRDKLLAYHFWTFSWSSPTTAELNVDISEIVFIYSETRLLDDSLVDKLFECLSPAHIGSFPPKYLGRIRYNAIRALFNCSLRKKNIFSSQRRREAIKGCENFKCEDRYKINSFIIKILNKDTENASNSKVFELALQMLEESDIDVDDHLRVIIEYTWDPLKADKYFDSDVKTKLVGIITSDKFDATKRRGCADVIHSYLSSSSPGGILAPQQFKRLLNVIHEPNMFVSVFPSIILGIEKGCLLSAFTIDDLNIIIHLLFSYIRNFSGTGRETVYCAICVLAKVADQKNVSIKIDDFDHQTIETYFFDETRVVQTNNDVEFCRNAPDSIPVSGSNTTRTSDLNRGTSISYYVADMYLKSLKRFQIYDSRVPCLETLLKCLEQNRDKQSRICLAEILYWKRKHFSSSCVVSAEAVARLANLVKDPVVDVRVFSLTVYVYFLSEHYTTHDDELMDFIVDHFVYDQLTLDDLDLTDEVNDSILKIFLNSARRGDTLPDKVFEIFNYILSVDQNYVESVLNVLHAIVSDRKFIPLQTMFALKNVLSRNKSIFELCIENGQRVPGKVIDSIVEDLYSHDKDVRSEAFRLLDKADENQDLGDNAFSVLEMERVGRVFEYCVTAVYGCKYLLECVGLGKVLTPHNFEAFAEMIETNDEQLIILVARILIAVASEQKKQIPDFLLCKLASVVNVKSDKALISCFGQIVSHVLNNNQIVSDSTMHMSKLEHFLELQLSDEEFSDIFYAIVAIAETKSSEHVIELPDAIIIKLLQRMRVSELCCKHFAKLLPKIIKCTQTPDVIKHAKTTFSRYISSTEHNLGFYSVLGFLEISNTCASNLDSNDLAVLFESAENSDDNKFNKIVLEIVARYELTPEQIVRRDYVMATRNAEYYFERLSASEEQDDCYGVGKYLFCVKDIFASDNTVLVVKAAMLLKRLSLNRDMIHFITPDILKALIGIELNAYNSDDMIFLMYELVVEAVQFQEGNKAFFLSTVEVEKLCDFAKHSGKNKKFFQKLLGTILSKYKLPSHDQQKIEMTLIFAKQYTNTRSLESIETILQKVVDGTFLDLEQIKSLIEDFHKNVRHSMSKSMVETVLIVTRLICIHLDQGRVNLVELLDGSAEQLMEIVEYVIKDPIKISLDKHYFIKGFEIVLKYAATLNSHSLRPYFELIPSILEVVHINDSQFKVVSARYILTCIEYWNIEKLKSIPYSNLLITWLENGLDDSENLVRTFSFDSLRKLYQIGSSSNVFQKWSLNVLKSISKATRITFSKELSAESLEILHTTCLARHFNLKILQNKNISASSIRFEILSNDIFQRYLSVSNDLIFFSDCFAKLLSTEFYSDNPELICDVLETLIVAADLGHIKTSDFGTTILCLMHVHFETFSTLARTHGQSLFNDIRRRCIFEMIKNKLDDPLNSRNTAVNTLVLGIEAQIDFQDLYRLLGYIETIDSLETMHSMCQFVCENRLNTNELLLYACRDASQMLKQLQVNFLTKSMCPEATNKANILLTQLFDRGFTIQQLEPLFHSFRNSNEQTVVDTSEIVKSILTLLVQFRMDPKECEVIECIKRICKSMEDERYRPGWFSKANSLAVECVFESDSTHSKIKSLEQISTEFRQENAGYGDDMEINSLRTKVQNIKNKNRITGIEGFPSEWKKKDFQTWATKAKSNHFENEDFIEEALAVLMAANEKCYHYKLRDTQILSCLVAMKHRVPAKGLLQQIVTGGGKSTIIRLLAILLALKGYRVFVVTSNFVLAERDTRECRQLFEMFKLTADHNKDPPTYIRGPKSCYSRDVVFGVASQFQFDILRDEYSDLGTLNGRQLDVVIVDEVDNMFIDDSSKSTRLSSTIPGMSQLQLIYHFVWSKLNEIQSRIFRIENRTFLALGKLNLINGILSLSIADDNGQVVCIENFHDFIQRGNDTNGFCIEIKDVTEGIANHLKNYLLALVTDQKVTGYEIKPENKMQVPKHLESFVKSQIPRWVDNALTALQYTENVHYIVDEEVIKPVDFDTTGVIQNSTSWGDGLHQFLQIKHNLPMTPENLATNYLSTLGFFKRFESRNIYGFTGTFGSTAAKTHTEQLYSVDLVTIPDSNIKQIFDYECLVLPTKADWISAIVQSTEFEIKKKRACLIICRTIREAEYIHQNLTNRAVRMNSVKLYTSNLSNEEKCVEKIVAGEVIVATNLAGRGTDIKTERTVEVSGGLHVCMTFLPPSQRAEDQAIGRTSRFNNVGTYQFILFGSAACSTDLRAIRDHEEEKYLKEFRQNIFITKDEIFETFCQLLKFVREKLKSQISFTGKIKSFLGRNIPTIYETNMLSAVEERWALFIREVESKFSDPEYDAFDDYYTFDNKIRSIFKGDPKGYINAIESPFYAICIGNYYASNERIGEALEFFNHAIALDESFSAAAFVGRSWCLVSPESKFVFWNENYTSDYKNDAITSMEFAYKLLENERAYLITSNSLSSVNEETGLSKQLLRKLNILGKYINSVEMAINTVRKSQRLIDLSYRKRCQSEREDHYGKERDQLDDKYSEYIIDVAFHDLTRRDDCGITDQAIELVSTHPVREFQLQIFETESDSLLAYFSPDVEYSRKSKNDALKIFDVCEAHGEPKAESKLKVTSKSYYGKFKATAKSAFAKLKPKANIQFTCTIYRRDNREAITFNAESQKEVIDKLQSCDDLDIFDIKVCGVNETPKMFEKSKFALSLLQIKAETAKDIFETINTDTVLSVKIFGKTNDLLEFCGNPQILNLKFWKHQTKDNARTSKLVTVKQLESHEKFSCIELPKNVLSLFKDDWLLKLSIDILIKSLDLATVVKFLKCHKGGRVHLAIDANEAFAKVSIPSLRDAKVPFAIKFSNLTYNEANDLIKSKCITEEDIILDKQKSMRLPSYYLKDHIPKEIDDLLSRGLEYLLVFNEKQFVPWYSIASVFAIGAIQLIVGGLLLATGLGAPIGMALCTEGCVDLLFALRTYRSRNFTWKDYGIQKSISLLVSVSTLGLGAFKNAGTGIASFCQGVQTEAAEQGLVQFVLNGKSVFNVASDAVSSLKILALKQMGISVSEAAARETLFQLSDKVTNFMFNQFEDTIENCISTTLKIAVFESSLVEVLNRLHTYNTHIHKKQNTVHIVSQYLENTVNHDDRNWAEHFKCIGVVICQGIASNSTSLENNLVVGSRLFTMLWGAVELKNMENDLCKELNDRLQKHEQKAFSLVEVIMCVCDLDAADAIAFSNVINNHCGPGINSLNDLLVGEKFESLREIEITAFRAINCFGEDGEFVCIAKERLVDKCKAIKSSLNAIIDPLDLHSEMLQTIVKAITHRIVQISHNTFITPVSSLAIGQLVRKVSNYAQASLIVSHNQNSSSQNKDQLKYDDLMNKIKNAKSISEDEMNFVLKYKDERENMTIARQISSNAMDLQNAKQLIDISRSSGHSFEQTSDLVTEERFNYAKSVGSVAKKAGLLEMKHLSEINNCKLVITGNVNEVEYLTQKFKDRHVLVYSQKENSPISFQLFDSDGKHIKISVKSTEDAGYKILEHLTGQKETDLRRRMAKDILCDKNMVTKIKAESFIQKYGQSSLSSALPLFAKIKSEYLPLIITKMGKHAVNSVPVESVTSSSPKPSEKRDISQTRFKYVIVSILLCALLLLSLTFLLI